MRRLVVNRWLAFVLTLIILSSSGMFVPSWSRADNGMDPVSIGDPSNTQPAGDPDGPSGPTKRASSGRSVRVGRISAALSVGDGSSVSVWKWRIQVLLQALRIRFTRL